MDRVLDIAIAASAREWPDRLHRHVLDHGGARVSGRLLAATQAVDSRYDVLLIDDICSFLSPGLISMLRQDGRQVLGVYDRDDGPDAKRRLLECGISDVIESDATADEFLAQAAAVAEAASLTPWPAAAETTRGWTIGVVGVTAGAGATEVAVGLAWSLSRKVDTVLVDADPSLASVAQRLDLPPHPNLLTLIDAVVHGYVQDEAEVPCGRLRVVPGAAMPGQAVPRHEIDMALDALSARSEVLVADLGEATHSGDGALERFDALVVVFSGDPVGVTRLARDARRWSRLADSTAVVLVANRCPDRRFHRGEVGREIEEALGPLPLITIPHDDRVVEASWEGVAVDKGRFGKEMARMANLVASAVAR